MSPLLEFVRESNRIEGIHRPPTPEECQATDDFVTAETLTVESLKALVKVLQPNAELRNRRGLNVRVGPHTPPPGGPEIEKELTTLLMEAAVYFDDPFGTHHAYETLHPFTDGNGRSGRALWLWQILRAGGDVPRIGFLHTWYYQSLQAGRELHAIRDSR